jgi:acyl dehydratase
MMWFEDFDAAPNETWVSRRRTVTEADSLLFTAMTGITDPVFTDEIFARENLFGGRVVPGPMVMAYAMGLTDEMCSGTVVAALGINNAKFMNPVRPQDTIWVHTRVVSARASESRPEHGVVTLGHIVESDRAAKVQQFERTLLVLRKQPAPSVAATQGAKS